MKHYLLESLAPLVCRSGRPFGTQADADDINFPLPSAAAGLMRSQHLEAQGWILDAETENSTRGRLRDDQHHALQQLASKGPFLAQEDRDGNITVLVPKPADALYLQERTTNKTNIHRLRPAPWPHDADGCDLPPGLLPVQLQNTVKGKPQPGPAYWPLEHSLRWQRGESLNFADLPAHTLPIETRTHVQIDRERDAAAEGRLYQTAAYDLQAARKSHHQGWEERAYRLLIQSEVDSNSPLVRLGGEGRLSRCRQIPPDPAFTPAADLAATINASRGLRLTLLTPAIFQHGWRPGWLDDTLHGTLPHTDIRVRLHACAIERWQPVSGWDMHHHRPKATRKAVAAGAVYWLETLTPADHIAALAFTAISDDPQTQRDGFGIVSIAAWHTPT